MFEIPLQYRTKKFPELKQAQVILFYDMPLITLMHSLKTNSFFITALCDMDTEAGIERAITYPISIEQITEYFKGNITLKSILQTNKNVYLIDYDDKKYKVYNIPIELIPEDYIPSDTSFFWNDKGLEIFNNYLKQLEL